MKYKLILVCLGFFCAQTLCAEELSSEDKLSIARLDASYRNDLVKIKNSYKEQMTKLDELYSNYLEKALDGFKKSGDLDKSLAAKKEIKRFSESKSIPVKLSEIPEIKKLQEAYRTQEAAYKLSSSKEIVAMGEKLSSKLDQLQVELVKSDRLDAALLAKNTSAAITASQDFSDAKKITDAGDAQTNGKNLPRAGVLYIVNQMQESELSGAANLQYQEGQLRVILDKKYTSNWLDISKIEGVPRYTSLLVGIGETRSCAVTYLNGKLGSNDNWLDITQIDHQLREIEMVGRGLPVQKLQYQDGKLRISMGGRNGDWIIIKKLATNEPAKEKVKEDKEEDKKDDEAQLSSFKTKEEFFAWLMTTKWTGLNRVVIDFPITNKMKFTKPNGDSTTYDITIESVGVIQWKWSTGIVERFSIHEDLKTSTGATSGMWVLTKSK
jgi:hypothetical protein